MYLADIIALSTLKPEFFVIGGEQMYKLYGRLCNRIHLTQIFSPMKPRPGDAIFDYPLDGRQWKTLIEEEIPAGPKDDFPSRYTVLDRKFKTVRYVELEDFYTGSTERRRWVTSQLKTIENSIAKGLELRAPTQLHMFEETIDNPEN
jgi:dihydrofolate reductase